MLQRCRRSKPSRVRCLGTGYLLVPTDNVAEKHRIFGDGKTFDKQQEESKIPCFVEG